ncbi:cysteine proteinase inhibitor 8 [Brachypodium distachyon]|uniref:Cystatin domain-containing protein n=1 Tax=Brachypodium distachyon TaxID=15368 RepID=I1GSR9_BRADI|nr:cysteine proteinase inhibitor 8 [Brachypodium distachyon]KQK15427.1 hypothetical protein BRADI_1g22700v3 [Brachypodium distachyon]|eukprot:XP_003562767.1 cysteine proteinase inhibitor 8 [Brachypodium distachyon]
MARAFLLLAVLAAAVAAGASAAGIGGGGGGRRGHGTLFGGWRPIPDVSEPRIQELGGWAVAQHARLATDRLRFLRVTRGEQQVVAGMNYRLFVDAQDAAGRSAPYVAVVYEQSWTNTRKLTSFDPAAN